jgi:hypothetical protein
MRRPLLAGLAVLALALPHAGNAQLHVARHELTLTGLQRALDELTPGGWVPDHVTADAGGGAPRFSVVWRRDPGASWEARYHLTGAELQAALDELTPRGFVPTRIAGYDDGGTPRFAAVWRRERGVTWEARFGVDADEFRRQLAAWSGLGYAPSSVSAYSADGEDRFAAIWRREIGGAPLPARGAELPIEPVVQRTRVWCWLAIGEMVFRHFEIPNLDVAGDFQCGIIGMISGERSRCARNCYGCERGSGSNAGVVAMLADYARLAGDRTVRYREGSVASPLAVMESIDAGRPIIAGTSASRRRGTRDVEHVALIVGYEVAGDGLHLVVNDPFPYAQAENPFLAHGGVELRERQYRIPYERFRDGLFWHWSVYDITIV